MNPNPQPNPDPNENPNSKNDRSKHRDRSGEAATITCFRDALGLAMELADEYAFVNAGVVLDQFGVLTDIVLAEGIGRTVEPVTRWLVEAAGCWPDTAKLLLISVRPFDVDVIREQDLQRYRAASWVLAGAGGHLIDWIETDGDLFRSYAYVTCPANAWEGDRREDRLSDGSSS